jgi:hypothetical protein
MLGPHRFEHFERLIAIDVVVRLFPTAEHRVAGGDDEIADDLLLRNPLTEQSGGHTDPGGQLTNLGPPDRFTEQEGAAAGGVGLGGGHPHQRGLARAVGSEDDPSFIQFDLPGDGPDECVPAAPQRHVLEVDQ